MTSVLCATPDLGKQAWNNARSLIFDVNDSETEDEDDGEGKILVERKKKGLKAVLVLLLYKLLKRRRTKFAGRSYAVIKKTRKDFWKVVKHLHGRQFRNAFRMTVSHFRLLTAKLEPKLNRNKHMAERSSGPLQADVKIALMMRMLAGACYQDLCMIFKIPSSSVYDIFHRCLNALTQTFSLSGIPTDERELKEKAMRFKCSRRRGSPLNGCIGALDGIAIKIRKPWKLHHPSLYYCRKQFYAIPVQAMVDADYRFRCFSAICVGSTHDSLSHSVSSLGKYLREGKLVGPFWIAADEAYICTECLLTPFAKSQMDRLVISKYKDSYNYYHSSLRMHVEQAFGMLVGRFGILWKPLCYSLQTNTKIILAAMILHNFTIDHSEKSDTMSMLERRQHGRAFKTWYDRCRNDLAEQHEAVVTAQIAGIDRALDKSGARREMVERLKYLRLQRPYGQHRFDNEGSSDDE